MFDHLPQPYPPPIAHKVWILDCKACATFLTNRAMKAVLLLRPSVSLYSSDALPVNCSPHDANPDALRPVHAHKPSSSLVPSRTCECLTQTLCCHGCGAAIGYIIVIPCSRCTSSITVTNRATNGHRFVFHSTEVTATERHYIKNEPGVVPFDPSPVLQPFIPPPQHLAYPSPSLSPYPLSNEDIAHARFLSPAFRVDYLPTPPLEFANPVLATSRHQSPESDALQYYRVHSHSFHPRSPPPLVPSQSPYHPLFPRPSSPESSSTSSPPPLISPTLDQKDPPVVLPSLKPGDVIFWHHLARTGEISGVADDERAREPASARAAGHVFFDR